MQKTIFYPKYRIRHSLDVLSLSILLAIALAFSFFRLGLNLWNILGVGYLIYFISLFSRLYIRRIVFTDSSLIVHKYVWPPIQIDYSDVTDMGISTLKTRNGKISFAAMSNIGELKSLLFEQIRQGKIDSKKFENKVVDEEMSLRKTFLPTVIISAVLGGTFLLYWHYHQPDLPLLIFWLAPVFIVVSVNFLIHWINKKRTKIP